ncbi:histidine phosphatase family protein [Lederbergia sp. NSJ-179]|uniref:histidine phosphatase family protein n=1 Tax=Lederbergia sp. NSJ-179 TaxID=2931402 RepID=UPI001FD1EBFB|nr:histidine phosphatase family protein [Lederbergia sp. NSJ-179]MCJ7842285.1 histidine phosphatase family protein [Lederbergia sp. NSJ-179]
MELYLIRHGESEGNRTGRDIPDCPLTNLGEKQANLVVQGLIDAEITHILSSPLIRTLQTAQPFAKAVNKPIFVLRDAYEVRTLESCKGARLSDLVEQFPEAKFPEDFEPDGWPYPGKETPPIIMKRAANLAKHLKQYPDDAKIAMFAHGTLNNYLIKELIGLTDGSDVYFRQENTCINWLTITEEFTRVNKIGDINHLRELSTAQGKSI